MNFTKLTPSTEQGKFRIIVTNAIIGKYKYKVYLVSNPFLHFKVPNTNADPISIV